MRLVILGAPRTKKNSPRIARAKRGGRPFVLPSAAYERWEAHAILQARAQFFGGGHKLITTPCAMRAVFYRERAVGDLGNFLAAACDMLEHAGVVENDALIQSFDGSRLCKDAQLPRCEIEITLMRDA